MPSIPRLVKKDCGRTFSRYGASWGSLRGGIGGGMAGTTSPRRSCPTAARAVGGVVQRDQHGRACVAVQVVGRRQRVRGGGLRVEPSFVDDARIGDPGGVLPAPASSPPTTTRDHGAPGTVVAPGQQVAASRENLLPPGSMTGTTATGASMQNTGASSTRPCMKSPPWRIQ